MFHNINYHLAKRKMCFCCYNLTKALTSCAQIRSHILPLHIEIGQYATLGEENWICPMCDPVGNTKGFFVWFFSRFMFFMSDLLSIYRKYQ